ncbi:related to conserved hypothetical Ustilaginaceae-specific protein [Ustilago trichophora]|uniref:Related to conserved hypothetical Ustilaginaceae-specific protein n=1 Tax=Ustilago trichophora TaxID=86804 RepID=A0A5C3ER66_9BASI|nr:related to conserved hypothetical Ustilaginaceae-specific protein [Ustilago trichophora]
MRSFTPLLVCALLALLHCTYSVLGARQAYCTANKDGTGDPDYQVTKDCCAATREHSTTAFNEVKHVCQDAGGLGNGINLGRFVNCCGQRGDGSHSPE